MLRKYEKSQSLVNMRRRTMASTAKESLEAEEEESPAQGKKLTNLKDFYALTGGSDTVAKGEEEVKEEDKPSPCEEAAGDPFDWVGYSQANGGLTVYCNRLPPPQQLGHGNPFLMFLCLACLLQHR